MSNGEQKGHKSLTPSQKRAISRKAEQDAALRLKSDVERVVEATEKAMREDQRFKQRIDTAKEAIKLGNAELDKIEAEIEHTMLSRAGLCEHCNQKKDHERMNREDRGTNGSY